MQRSIHYTTTRKSLTMDNPTYPLMDHPDALHAASGKSLPEIDLNSAVAGQLDAEDLRIHGETLQAQAAIARQHGYPQLAENLQRAAELTRVPNEELLTMYELLRPERASVAELHALAQRLEESFNAPANAALVREAAQVYQERRLLRRDVESMV